MPQEQQLAAKEVTFRALDSQFAHTHACQDLLQMTQVRCNVSTEDDNVIHVNTCKVFQSHQLLIHEALEGAGGVGQPKGHDLELVQTPLAGKGRPVLVGGLNLNLMVALLQVQTGKHLAPMQAIKQFIDAWQWVAV